MNQAPTKRHLQEAKNCLPQFSTKMTHYQEVFTVALDTAQHTTGKSPGVLNAFHKDLAVHQGTFVA